MKKWIKLLAVVLALVFLCGCSSPWAVLLSWLPWGRKMVHYSEMEYQRPELEGFRVSLEQCMELAEDGEDFRELEMALNEFLTEYNGFCTQYALANLKYSHDTSSRYWTKEYEACMEMTSEVDAGLDQLFYCLADSEFREKLEGENYFGEGYFDDYEGESLWDETFTALMEEEAELISAYNEVYARVGQEDLAQIQEELSQLYVELIQKRQEIADYAGYEDYAHFAYEETHSRGYGPEEEAAYEQTVQEVLVPVLQQIVEQGIDGIYYEECDEENTFQYVQTVAQEMGGAVEEAFQWMVEAGLYDIEAGENKYDASFTMYISDYYVPFVFVNPEQTTYDMLTFTHEFGHFSSSFVSYGGVGSLDVEEVFSQGLEYLSLCQGAGEDLEKLSMFNSLCVQVEQSAFASFERQAYALEGDALTGEALDTLFADVMEDFGLDVWLTDARYYTLIPHYYISPMYVFSYVVSNDTAMQIYELEQREAGAGRQVYLESLGTAAENILEFTEAAGLESPFAQGRLERLAEVYLEILQ